MLKRTWLTTQEVEKLLKISRTTLYRWEKRGLIPSPKRLVRTNQRMYSQKDLEKIQQWKEKTIQPRSES